MNKNVEGKKTAQELFPRRHASAQKRIYLVEGVKAPLSVLLENHPGLIEKEELHQKPLRTGLMPR